LGFEVRIKIERERGREGERERGREGERERERERERGDKAGTCSLNKRSHHVNNRPLVFWTVVCRRSASGIRAPPHQRIHNSTEESFTTSTTIRR
jgi:hypothetical protein